MCVFLFISVFHMCNCFVRTMRLSSYRLNFIQFLLLVKNKYAVLLIMYQIPVLPYCQFGYVISMGCKTTHTKSNFIYHYFCLSVLRKLKMGMLLKRQKMGMLLNVKILIQRYDVECLERRE